MSEGIGVAQSKAFVSVVHDIRHRPFTYDIPWMWLLAKILYQVVVVMVDVMLVEVVTYG